MDWGRSYTASWRVFRVNRETWADAEQVRNVDAVEIARTADGNLLESGGLEVTGELAADYYRIVMTAEQGGEVTRVDVGTLLFDVTGGSINHSTTVQEMDGFSVLYPASRTAIVAGEYAPAGVDGAAYAGKLLAGAINAPVEVEGGFTLNNHVVHEFGCSVLDAVWAVLEAGGFIIQIDGRGVVHIRKKPEEPAFVLDNRNIKLLSNGIDYTTDISDIPNRYIVIVNNNRTIAVNNDPGSIVSAVSRGYFVDEVDESPKPVNGETLTEYAERKLEEASIVNDEREYTREYIPGIYLYSIIRASIDGLQGDLRVIAQTINCGNGITVSETGAREVSVWQKTA